MTYNQLTLSVGGSSMAENLLSELSAEQSLIDIGVHSPGAACETSSFLLL